MSLTWPSLHTMGTSPAFTVARKRGLLEYTTNSFHWKLTMPRRNVNMSRKIFFFDLFGTIFDMANATRQELGAYDEQLARYKETGKWRELHLPIRWITELQPYPDVHRGMAALQNEGHTLCTLSNCPIYMQVEMKRWWELEFDFMVPLECMRVFKPNPIAYEFGCNMLGLGVGHERGHVKQGYGQGVMVSGNLHFGDLEAAKALGMQSLCIRNPGHLYDMEALAEYVESELGDASP